MEKGNLARVSSHQRKIRRQTKSRKSPCRICPKFKNGCNNTCPELDQIIPCVYAGCLPGEVSLDSPVPLNVSRTKRLSAWDKIAFDEWWANTTNDNSERLALIYSNFHVLTSRQCEVMKLRLTGASVRDIKDELGMKSRGAVTNHYDRAVNRLKKVLS